MITGSCLGNLGKNSTPYLEVILSAELNPAGTGIDRTSYIVATYASTETLQSAVKMFVTDEDKELSLIHI